MQLAWIRRFCQLALDLHLDLIWVWWHRPLSILPALLQLLCDNTFHYAMNKPTLMAHCTFQAPKHYPRVEVLQCRPKQPGAHYGYCVDILHAKNDIHDPFQFLKLRISSLLCNLAELVLALLHRTLYLLPETLSDPIHLKIFHEKRVKPRFDQN